MLEIEEITPVADYACHTGEGPLYHPDENAVYWTDIPQGKLFRYDLATGQHAQVYEGEPVGGMTLQEDGSLLLFCARGAVKRRSRDGSLTTVLDEIPDERTTRFNDVWADPEGRVFCGTMPTKERPGRLYRLDPDRSLHLLLEGIGCSNGTGLAPDGRTLYYTDTGKNEIYQFDYDRATGAITNQRVFVRVPREPGEGYPDGMTVDAEGFVWSARWDGGCVVRYSPDGQEAGRITFPEVKKVSCPVFGGPGYADLWVTTAGGHQKEHDGQNAGALFRLRIKGIRGVPEFRSRIQVT
jgi:D-xylonolactonase